MKIDVGDCSVIGLAPRCALELPVESGLTVSSVRGTLWVTSTLDRRDVLLEAGESVTLEGRGKAYVTAMGEAAVRVTSPAKAANAGIAGVLWRWWINAFDMQASERHAVRQWGWV